MRLIICRGVVAIFLLVITILMSPVTSRSVVSGQAPTDTPSPQPKNPLSTQLGFSDQTLDELQRKGLDTVESSLDFSGYNHSYRLINIVGRTSPNPMPTDGVVLLYQTDVSKPQLVWKWTTGGSKVLLTDQGAEGNVWPLPGDWLRKSRIMFAVFTIRDSTGWASALLHVFELHQDQTVTSVLKDAVPSGHIVKSVKIEDQGGLLLVLHDLRGEGTMGLSNCCGPRMRRFFEWDGKHVADVSTKHLDEYYETIGTLLYSSTTWKVEGSTGQEANLFAKNLLEVLMIYESTGQRDAGWLLVQNLVAQAETSGRLAANTYVDEVFMPAMSQLFKNGKPFVPPDYTAPNPPKPQGYYKDE